MYLVQCTHSGCRVRLCLQLPGLPEGRDVSPGTSREGQVLLPGSGGWGIEFGVKCRVWSLKCRCDLRDVTSPPKLDIRMYINWRRMKVRYHLLGSSIT